MFDKLEGDIEEMQEDIEEGKHSGLKEEKDKFDSLEEESSKMNTSWRFGKCLSQKVIYHTLLLIKEKFKYVRNECFSAEPLPHPFQHLLDVQSVVKHQKARF